MSIIKLKSLVEESCYRIEEENPQERTMTISLNEARELLRREYTEAVDIYKKDTSFGLYRAYSGAPPHGNQKFVNRLYLVEPTKTKRRSKEANNFYTEFISSSPLWKDYPKRDHAIIGSTHPKPTVNYGPNLFLVIPRNGAKFAVCSRADCWESFLFASRFFALPDDVRSIGIDSITSYMAKFFTIVFKMMGLETKDIYQTMDNNARAFVNMVNQHWKDIVNEIPNVINLISDNKHGHYNKQTIDRLTHFAYIILRLKGYGSFETFVEEMFEPKKNGIELISNIKKFHQHYKEKIVEFWTDSDCILIPESFRHIIRFSKNEENPHD